MLWERLNSGNQVFILDIDGTLMPSAKIDDECFWQAVFACFGETVSVPNLHGFRNVTDSGILSEWCKRELGRAPRQPETEQIKKKFKQLLQSASSSEPDHFCPLPGVTDWLEAVAERDGVFAGIATGGWGRTARLKLELSGLDRFDLPMASSDDAEPRTRIMQIAARRTCENQAVGNSVFTYIGDGVWDLHASMDLKWEFIGIASGARAAELSEAGAEHIRTDFCKTEQGG